VKTDNWHQVQLQSSARFEDDRCYHYQAQHRKKAA